MRGSPVQVRPGAFFIQSFPGNDRLWKGTVYQKLEEREWQENTESRTAPEAIPTESARNYLRRSTWTIWTWGLQGEARAEARRLPVPPAGPPAGEAQGRGAGGRRTARCW